MKVTWVAATLVAAAALAPLEARAQTTSSSGTTTTGESITLIGVANPNRFFGPANLQANNPAGTRNQNQNPTGVSFLDCENNLILQFPLYASGFTGTDHIEVWTGLVDCTQDANRSGTTSSGAQLCWQVAQPITVVNTTYPVVNLYARDILRFENYSTVGTAAGTGSPLNNYDPNWVGTAASEAACHVQTTDAAVTFTIYFLEVNSGIYNTSATDYQPQLVTDLVAPPAPVNVTVTPGDTLLQVGWTSTILGADPDLAGYQLFSDPPAGGVASAGGCNCGSSAGNASSYVGDGATIQTSTTKTEYICADGAVLPYPYVGPDASADADADADADAPEEGADDDTAADEDSAGDGTTSGDDGADDGTLAGDDGAGDGTASEDDGAGDAQADGGDADSGDEEGSDDSGDAAEQTSVLSGCTTRNVSPDSGAGSCYSANLAPGFTVGTSYTTTDEDAATDDEAGTDEDAATEDETATSTTSTTGLAGISQIAPQFGVPGGMISDPTQQSLTIDGLTNGLIYRVVVSSVDLSQNVGPASLPACATPAPVADFYQTYRQASGGAPSGSCTLEGAGIPVHAPASAVAFVGAVAAWLRRRRRS